MPPVQIALLAIQGVRVVMEMVAGGPEVRRIIADGIANDHTDEQIREALMAAMRERGFEVMEDWRSGAPNHG